MDANAADSPAPVARPVPEAGEGTPAAPPTAAPADRALLAAVCALAAVLYAWAINANGWGNTYYTIAVRSMSASLRDFLFGSLDSFGTITVDKPPLALWPQVIATWMFGFHGWAVLLPQVVEGVAAVALLHRVVLDWAGRRAALIAALLLALTPITVAIDRDNNPDTLLVLLLVAAAYAVTRALRADRTPAVRSGWLALAGLLVGCGFTTKMLQAWIVLPAFALAWMIGSPTALRRRWLDLGVAGLVTAVSSLWWPVLVTLWPQPKPYIGSTTHNSVWELIVGYNGLGRLFGGQPNLAATGPSQPAGLGGSAFLAWIAGAAGPGRLFDAQNGTQISWLLPLCGFLLLAGAVALFRSRATPLAARRAWVAGWVLWGGWLLTAAVVFSFTSGAYHPYYTTMLAPAIAALCGAGLVWLWHKNRHGSGLDTVLLPVATLLTGAWAVVLAARDPAIGSWSGWVIAVAAGLAAVALWPARPLRRCSPAAGLGLACATVAVLLAPAVWCGVTVFGPSTALLAPSNPIAGPGDLTGALAVFSLQDELTATQLRDVFQRQGLLGDAPAEWTLRPAQRAVLHYAETHAAGSRISLAVEGGVLIASPYLLSDPSGVTVFGGYFGTDPQPSLAQLAAWNAANQIGFVLAPSPGRVPLSVLRAMSDSQLAALDVTPQAHRILWIQRNCAIVPPGYYGLNTFPVQPPSFVAQSLYRCGAAGR